MGFEDQIPPIPNRDQEKRYIATVPKSFYDQPLYKFYMNEALRERQTDYVAKQNNTCKYERILNFVASGRVYLIIFNNLNIMISLFLFPIIIDQLMQEFQRTLNIIQIVFLRPKNKAVLKQGSKSKQEKIQIIFILGFLDQHLFTRTYKYRSQIHDEYCNNVGATKPKFE